MDRVPIEPERLVIRSAEPADAHAVSALLGSTGVFEQLLQMPDVPIASRLEFLQRGDALGCQLLALVDGEIVGQAGLHAPHASLRRRHARGLGMAIAPEWQGRGIGRQLLQRLLAWADDWAGVLRVELWVHADNERAIALYRKLGFAQEGRHRAYALRGGSYIDSLSMARLHPAPPAFLE